MRFGNTLELGHSLSSSVSAPRRPKSDSGDWGEQHQLSHQPSKLAPEPTGSLRERNGGNGSPWEDEPVSGERPEGRRSALSIGQHVDDPVRRKRCPEASGVSRIVVEADEGKRNERPQNDGMRGAPVREQAIAAWDANEPQSKIEVGTYCPGGRSRQTPNSSQAAVLGSGRETGDERSNCEVAKCRHAGPREWGRSAVVVRLAQECY